MVLAIVAGLIVFAAVGVYLKEREDSRLEARAQANFEAWAKFNRGDMPVLSSGRPYPVEGLQEFAAWNPRARA